MVFWKTENPALKMESRNPKIRKVFGYPRNPEIQKSENKKSESRNPKIRKQKVGFLESRKTEKPTSSVNKASTEHVLFFHVYITPNIQLPDIFHRKQGHF